MGDERRRHVHVLVKNPQDYSVLVASNMFGDIISDLCAQLVGGLGFAASANLGDDYAIFEPTHGSAPKYAGLYLVNPIAMLISTRLILEYLGEHERAARLERGIERTIAGGRVLTYDMERRPADPERDRGRTLEVAEEVVRNMD